MISINSSPFSHTVHMFRFSNITLEDKDVHNHLPFSPSSSTSQRYPSPRLKLIPDTHLHPIPTFKFAYNYLRAHTRIDPFKSVGDWIRHLEPKQALHIGLTNNFFLWIATSMMNVFAHPLPLGDNPLSADITPLRGQTILQISRYPCNGIWSSSLCSLPNGADPAILLTCSPIFFPLSKIVTSEWA